MKRNRALIALLPIAMVGALLTSCTSSNEGVSTTGVDCTPAGAASGALKVEGDFGEGVTLTSEVPVESTTLERSVLINGEGAGIEPGDTVDTNMTIINGASGEVIDSQKNPLTFEQTQLTEWAFNAVNCSSLGDRVAAVAPVIDVLGEGGGAGFEMEDTDSLVMVFDFLEGCKELLPRDENYPEVDLGDGKSEPLITIPECMEPPAELEIDVLVEGDGPVVEADQKIMTNYVGVDWDGAVRFDGNWTETGIEFSTQEGALIAGFTQAMIGQKIGSTILVTMPSELGYNDGMTRTFVLQLVSVVS